MVTKCWNSLTATVLLYTAQHKKPAATDAPDELVKRQRWHYSWSLRLLMTNCSWYAGCPAGEPYFALIEFTSQWDSSTSIRFHGHTWPLRYSTCGGLYEHSAFSHHLWRNVDITQYARKCGLAGCIKDFSGWKYLEEMLTFVLET